MATVPLRANWFPSPRAGMDRRPLGRANKVKRDKRLKERQIVPGAAGPSGDGLEGSVRGFIFEAEEPVEMKFLRGQPFFQFFAIRGVEFGEHFSFLHVHQDAARSY